METTASHGSAPNAESPRLSLHLALGLAQGLVVWALYRAAKASIWPTTSRPVLVALICFTIAAPLAWYLWHAVFRSERTRALLALLVGTLFAALGAHAGSFADGDVPGSVVGYALAALVLGFVTVSLVAGWDARARRFDYLRLFELTWRNAVLSAIAMMLAGALWMLLFAGGWIMQSIGLPALLELYWEPAFYMPVTGAAIGLAFGLALGRAQMLVTVRRLVLSLLIWFLPLTLLFAVAWVAALPFTGVELLFSTRAAALYLLWFGALAVLFANAAFQDGSDTPAYPQWLAKTLTWAWLAMPVLVALAGWALWQRVAQHGWTPDRIWGAVVWTLVTIHVVGYACSIVRRDRWMHTIAATNLVAAFVEVAAITALISPIADMHRLTVSNQIARLRSGVVTPEAFDWTVLARETGRYGKAALRALATETGSDEHSKAVAARADDVLRNGVRDRNDPRQDPAIALKTLRERVVVRPVGAVPDARLLASLSRSKPDWHERGCISTPGQCALWLFDMDRDGKPEAVMLLERGGTATAHVYADTADGWRKQGSLAGPEVSLAQWLADIDRGSVAVLPPRWPDLTVNGRRLTLQP